MSSSGSTDIFEYEINLERRRNIENFVVDFFKDWAIKARNRYLVEICLELITDVRVLNTVEDLFSCVTEENFSDSFMNMGLVIFENGTKIGYIASILTFAVVLDRKMQSHEWYCSRLLFKGIIDVFDAVDFDPKPLNTELRTKEITRTIKESLIILLPSLLFYYFASNYYC